MASNGNKKEQKLGETAMENVDQEYETSSHVMNIKEQPQRYHHQQQQQQTEHRHEDTEQGTHHYNTSVSTSQESIDTPVPCQPGQALDLITGRLEKLFVARTASHESQTGSNPEIKDEPEFEDQPSTPHYPALSDSQQEKPAEDIQNGADTKTVQFTSEQISKDLDLLGIGGNGDFIQTYTSRLSELARDSQAMSDFDLGTFLCSFYVGLAAMPAQGHDDLSGTDVMRSLLTVIKYRVNSAWTLCTAHTLLSLLILEEDPDCHDSVGSRIKQEMIKQYFALEGPDLVLSKLYDQMETDLSPPVSSLLPLLVMVRSTRGRAWLHANGRNMGAFREMLCQSRGYLDWVNLSMRCGLKVKLSHLVDDFIDFVEQIETKDREENAMKLLEEEERDRMKKDKKKKKRNKKAAISSLELLCEGQGTNSGVTGEELCTEDDVRTAVNNEQTLPSIRTDAFSGVALVGNHTMEQEDSPETFPKCSPAREDLHEAYGSDAPSARIIPSEEFPPICRDCDEKSNMDASEGWVKVEHRKQVHRNVTTLSKFPDLPSRGSRDQDSSPKTGPMRWADVAKIGCPRDTNVRNWSSLFGDSRNADEILQSKMTVMCKSQNCGFGQNSGVNGDLNKTPRLSNDDGDIWNKLSLDDCRGDGMESTFGLNRDEENTLPSGLTDRSVRFPSTLVPSSSTSDKGVIKTFTSTDFFKSCNDAYKDSCGVSEKTFEEDHESSVSQTPELPDINRCNEESRLQNEWEGPKLGSDGNKTKKNTFENFQYTQTSKESDLEYFQFGHLQTGKRCRFEDDDTKSLVSSFSHLPALKTSTFDPKTCRAQDDSFVSSFGNNQFSLTSDAGSSSMDKRSISSSGHLQSIYTHSPCRISEVLQMNRNLPVTTDSSIASMPLLPNPFNTNTCFPESTRFPSNEGERHRQSNEREASSSLGLPSCFTNQRNLMTSMVESVLATTSSSLSFPSMSQALQLCKKNVTNTTWLHPTGYRHDESKSQAHTTLTNSLSHSPLDLLPAQAAALPAFAAKTAGTFLNHLSKFALSDSINPRQGTQLAHSSFDDLNILKTRCLMPRNLERMEHDLILPANTGQHLRGNQQLSPFQSLEKENFSPKSLGLSQATWSSPVDNRLGLILGRTITPFQNPKPLSWAERAGRQTSTSTYTNLPASNKAVGGSTNLAPEDFSTVLNGRLQQRQLNRQLNKQSPSPWPTHSGENNDTSPPVLFPSSLREDDGNLLSETETFPAFHDVTVGDLLSELFTDPMFIERVAISQIRQRFQALYCSPQAREQGPPKDSIFDNDLDYYASLYRLRLKDMLQGSVPVELGGFSGFRGGDFDNFYNTGADPGIKTGLNSGINLSLNQAMNSDRRQFSRWRDALNRLLETPWTMRKQFGHLILPHRFDEFKISDTEYPLILGFTTEGCEVAVLVLDKSVAYIDPCLLDIMCDPDLDRHCILKCKGVSETATTEYVGLELCDYTLSEYIQIVQLSHSQDPLSSIRLAWQLLEGLKFIHKYLGMPHGNLRPTWIFVDSEGRLRLGGYGITTKQTKGFTGGSPLDKQTGGRPACWAAAEDLNTDRPQSNTAADIQVAGMLLYFILTGGHHPFGSSPMEAQVNIRRHNLQLDLVSEEANHLISAMLNPDPTQRPKIDQCLKHPFFWSYEKKFRLILIVGSDVLTEMKTGVALTGSGAPTMMEILSVVDINDVSPNWVADINPTIMKEMRSFRVYKNNLTELTLFVYNCCLHFEKLSPVAKEALDDPCKYFLTLFPSLFMAIYRSLKASDRADRACYKPFL